MNLLSLSTHGKQAISLLTRFSSLALLTVTTSVFASDLTHQDQAEQAPNAEIALPTLTGETMTLSDYKGHVVLLDFWASWCGPCRESFPWMNEIQAKYADQGLKVIAINLDQDPQLARDFINRTPAHFSILLDSQAQMPDAFGVIGMPTSYLIDTDGKIRDQHVGFHSNRTASYEQQIIDLLNEQKQ